MASRDEIVGIAFADDVEKRRALMARKPELVSLILDDIELVPLAFTDQEFDILVPSDPLLEDMVEREGGSPYMPAETYEEMIDLLGDEI